MSCPFTTQIAYNMTQALITNGLFPLFGVFLGIKFAYKYNQRLNKEVRAKKELADFSKKYSTLVDFITEQNNKDADIHDYLQFYYYGSILGKIDKELNKEISDCICRGMQLMIAPQDEYNKLIKEWIPVYFKTVRKLVDTIY